MPYTIDNDTGQIVGSPLILRPLSLPKAPQPGGPWYDAPVEVRIANMQAAKHGGAYAEAIEMVALGYAIGAF